MSEPVHFLSDGLLLEGLLDGCDGDRGAVVAHPHPLYGGNMHNGVVGAMARTYRQQEITTVRFNFRGAGSSQGAYDEGRGEQADVAAAVAFLRDRGCTHITLAGYSFGAWVIAHRLQEAPLAEAVVLVSPPVAFMDFSHVDRMPGLVGVVTGSRDDIAPPSRIAPLLPRWCDSASFTVIPGADHFYAGRERALSDELSRLLSVS